MNAAEAIAAVEKELSPDEKKETEETSLADNLYFNLAFTFVVIAFWLKYFEIV